MRGSSKAAFESLIGCGSWSDGWELEEGGFRGGPCLVPLRYQRIGAWCIRCAIIVKSVRISRSKGLQDLTAALLPSSFCPRFVFCKGSEIDVSKHIDVEHVSLSGFRDAPPRS
jgi:hypothetical protein